MPTESSFCKVTLFEDCSLVYEDGPYYILLIKMSFDYVGLGVGVSG